jgi:hypothetical protein
MTDTISERHPTTPTGRRIHEARIGTIGAADWDKRILAIEQEAAEQMRRERDEARAARPIVVTGSEAGDRWLAAEAHAKALAEALREASKALGGYRVDKRSHAQYVAEDVFPVVDAALAAYDKDHEA